MASDSEQLVVPSTIDGYFQKAPSTGSVSANRTRNFDTKSPAQLPVEPAADKQTKLESSQSSSQQTTVTENPVDKLRCRVFA
ncbi:hypothetical protein MMC22_009754 [Lobaria immixta]|nr:hypothetical protein [Lobaria immixta]